MPIQCRGLRMAVVCLADLKIISSFSKLYHVNNW